MNWKKGATMSFDILVLIKTVAFIKREANRWNVQCLEKQKLLLNPTYAVASCRRKKKRGKVLSFSLVFRLSRDLFSHFTIAGFELTTFTNIFRSSLEALLRWEESSQCSVSKVVWDRRTRNSHWRVNRHDNGPHRRISLFPDWPTSIERFSRYRCWLVLHCRFRAQMIDIFFERRHSSI